MDQVEDDELFVPHEKLHCEEGSEGIPENYLNVGRFWGASRNLTPVPSIIEPRTIAKISSDWTEEQVYRFLNRTLRRFHERNINYDRDTWTKEKEGASLPPWCVAMAMKTDYFVYLLGQKWCIKS